MFDIYNIQMNVLLEYLEKSKEQRTGIIKNSKRILEEIEVNRNVHFGKFPVTEGKKNNGKVILPNLSNSPYGQGISTYMPQETKFKRYSTGIHRKPFLKFRNSLKTERSIIQMKTKADLTKVLIERTFTERIKQ